jgi:hypothetical protein
MSFQILLTQNKKADYLRYIEDAAELGLKEYPEVIENWKKQQTFHTLWGYDAPAHPVYLADILGFLYELTKEERYAKEAAKILSDYGDLRKYYPEEKRKQRIEYKDGVPSLSNFFYMTPYARAYLRIKDSKVLTKFQIEKIEKDLAFSVDFTFNFPEWGAHNRAMLRANAFYIAHLALPNHPNAKKWKQTAEIIAKDNLNGWEAEDASVYHPIWFYAMLIYAEISEDEKFFDSPILKYYYDYYTQLIAPNGNYVDFGDGMWNNGWSQFIPVFEKAATYYNNSKYKYIAKKLLDRAIEILNTQQKSSSSENSNLPSFGVTTASAFLDAYRWSVDIVPKIPTDLSREVLEDLVGKKIVFRNGWDNSSTYLLHNYQSEGETAFMTKYYLRNTICVEEEKMHHGHSDENSIVFLMSDKSLLLHDGGYRSDLPSGQWGAYRADYFHNKIIGRKNKIDNKQSLYEFIRNSGAYREVQSKKIDFLTLNKIDISRTRVIDEKIGFSNDRIIAYFKEHDFFVVIDINKALQNDYLTYTNLWHTETILKSGDIYFDTRFNKIQTEELPKNKSLLIYFPNNHLKTIGTFKEDRHYQEENAIYQYVSSQYKHGDIETFITILYPHTEKEDIDAIMKRFNIYFSENENGLCVEYKNGKSRECLSVKLDFEKEITKENGRPRYSYESGKVKYSDFETDAHFLHFIDSNGTLSFSAATFLKFVYKSQIIHEAIPTTHSLQPDGSEIKFAPTKWRTLEAEVKLK